MIKRLKSVYHFALAWLSNILYGFPSRKIFVIGVTGTKGKSTTLELISAVLEAAGFKTALLSSIRFKIGRETEKNTTGMTMPGRFFLQKFLRRAVKAGCRYALVEVTSQGILQHRHKFIDWDAALVTNVRPEHIEAHGSFENYRHSKLSFFEYVANRSRKPKKLFFVNDGDPSHQYFVSAANGSAEIRYFSRESFVEHELNRGKESIGEWLLSNFNLENAAATAAVAGSQGIGWALIKKTFKNFKGVPGRMEYVQESPFAVVIDYAHTPDSLAKIYGALTGDKRSGKKRLVCVLGAAGGDRDKWKRPVMGQIASEFCRQIVLTNEDPYDEPPEEIIAQIRSGISNAKFPDANLHVVVDRRAAIKKALSLAKKGDVVVITGKGSEDWIHAAGGKRIPWNERKVVEELL